VDEEARPMKDQEVFLAKKALARIFRTKTELRDVCLNQLNKSLRAPVNSLNAEYIREYIMRDNGKNAINVIVTWEGSSDENILKRLGITEFPLLNLRCYDKYMNQQFYLQLQKIPSKEIIFEIDVGQFNKPGRALNLTEAHSLVCRKKTQDNPHARSIHRCNLYEMYI